MLARGCATRRHVRSRTLDVYFGNRDRTRLSGESAKPDLALPKAEILGPMLFPSIKRRQTRFCYFPPSSQRHVGAVLSIR